jgi:hypothetical protein
MTVTDFHNREHAHAIRRSLRDASLWIHQIKGNTLSRKTPLEVMVNDKALAAIASLEQALHLIDTPPVTPEGVVFLKKVVESARSAVD